MKNVLFLGSDVNRDGEASLHLEELIRTISESVRKKKNNEELVLHQRWAVQKNDLFDAFNETRPEIIQFSCRTENGQLCLGDEEITAETLKEVLATIDCARMILLCGDDTEEAGKELLESGRLDAVLAIRGTMDPEVMRYFLESFYSAICYGVSLKKALVQGKARVKMARKPKKTAEQFRLITPTGVDADQIFFVREEEQVKKDPAVKSLYRIRVTPFYVNRGEESEELFEAIRERLDKENICYIAGLTGSGKSELARSFARNHGRQKVVEYYLDDTYQGKAAQQYERLVGESEYTDLCLWTMEESVAAAVRKQLYDDFLQNKSLIILHGYRIQHRPLIEKLVKGGAQLLITTEEKLEENGDVINLDNENLKRPDFLMNVFARYYSNNVKEENKPLLEHLVCEILKGNLMLIAMIALQLKQLSEDFLQMLLEDIQEVGLEEALDDSGTIKIKKDGKLTKRKPLETLKGLFAPGCNAELTEAEKQVLQVMQLLQEAWIPRNVLILLLGDRGMRNLRIAPAIQSLIRKNILMEKAGSQSLLSLSSIAVAAIRASKENEVLYVPEMERSFVAFLCRNMVYVPECPEALKKVIDGWIREEEEETKALIERAFQEGCLQDEELIFPYPLLLADNLKKIKRYFRHRFILSVKERKGIREIYVVPEDDTLKEFRLASWNEKERHYNL